MLELLFFSPSRIVLIPEQVRHCVANFFLFQIKRNDVYLKKALREVDNCQCFKGTLELNSKGEVIAAEFVMSYLFTDRYIIIKCLCISPAAYFIAVITVPQCNIKFIWNAARTATCHILLRSKSRSHFKEFLFYFIKNTEVEKGIVSIFITDGKFILKRSFNVTPQPCFPSLQCIH